jgi:hypothetical protein
LLQDCKSFNARYAYVLRGQRSKGFSFYIRGVRYTVLAAINSTMGVVAWRLFEGSANAETFMEFYRYVSLRMPEKRQGPGSYFVSDNASVHGKTLMHETAEATKTGLLFLPPYSPDFNPIEKAWAKFRAFLRGNSSRLCRMEVVDVVIEGLSTITISDCKGWVDFEPDLYL